MTEKRRGQRYVLMLLFWAVFFPTAAQRSGQPIDTLLRINLGNVDQTVFIKGKDRTKPVLLILHGGPGFSDFYLWQTYNQPLENHYTVVTWDQRGTGLSYHEAIPVGSMTFDQIALDAHELTLFLKRLFNQDKLYLIGYSGGSISGVNVVTQHPEDYKAFISVGQVVDGMQNEKLSLQYTIDKAREENNQKALNELLAIAKKYPAKGKDAVAYLKKQREWLRYYHGDLCEGTSMKELFTGLNPTVTKHYNQTLIDKGSRFSMETMWDQVIRVNFLTTKLEFKVPVYFVVGRCDYNAVHTLVEQYYKKIKAPSKQLIYFEKSGHYMPFTEPDKFNALLKNIAQ